MKQLFGCNIVLAFTFGMFSCVTEIRDFEQIEGNSLEAYDCNCGRSRTASSSRYYYSLRQFLPQVPKNN